MISVNWNKPDTTPDVKKYDYKEFWIAAERHYPNHEPKVFVHSAFYVNKPLEYAEDDVDFEEPLDEYHFVTSDGEPIECVGWFNCKEHAEFDGYYEPISFNEDYTLLGWAEYETPVFNKE